MTSTYENGSEIAIISMNGKFPGASNVERFWDNLMNGKESISFFSDEELLKEGIDPSQLNNTNYVKAGACIDDIEMFDASFFGFTPREAEIMDPQQRLFLECCWEALELAGHNTENYRGRIGVYAGVFSSTYLFNLYNNRALYNSVGELSIRHGNEKDYLATRVSYKLNLKGPSVNVQTSCSTSLVAVHNAIQSLLSGESDMALAGGVSIVTPQKEGYMYQEGGILSPDGHCRPFDANAKGTIFGNGMGVVVLKRLEDARKDRDKIFAVIKGSAINNDGADKVGFTAPSVNGQAEVIADAMGLADVDPHTVGMVEAHGTGTPLGDPIEITAISKVYREQTDEKGYCAIGSVKSNIGHLGVASGVAGLIKTALSLYHKKIPPTVNFEESNPNIDFENSPFYVNTTLKDWYGNKDFPRRAAVSNFGMGGTNAHIVLEEYNPMKENFNQKTEKEQLIVLSAKSEEALDDSIQQLREYLKANVVDLNHVAYTLQVGRREFSHRATVVAKTGEDVIELFKNNNRVYRGVSSNKRKVAYVFSGQGSQYVEMAKGLYDNQPVFRKTFDYCCEQLLPIINVDIRKLLYFPNQEALDSEELMQTEIAQPAIFALEYSLSKMLDSFGIRPQIMMGHSIGEYTAACLAGVFSLEDALSLVAIRGRLMQEMPSGKMLSVALSAEKAKVHLFGQLTIAAENTDNLCVVAGTEEEIAIFQKKMNDIKVQSRLLVTSHAFHSAMMDPILDTFTHEVSNIQLNKPKIPYISNYTGTWIKDEEAMSPSYWSKHLRNTVRFKQGIDTLLEDDVIIFEVGPGQTLTGFINQQKAKFNSKSNPIHLIRHPKNSQNDINVLLTAIGRFWVEGGAINWDELHDLSQVRRLPLPTYPFQKERFWITKVVSNTNDVHESSSCIALNIKFDKEIEHNETIEKEVDITTNPETKSTEERVGLIWSELFGIESIGINDDFFEIGGHSLLAIQLFNRIQEEFDVELQIEDMFDEPTILGLTKQVENVLRNRTGTEENIDENSIEDIEAILKELEDTAR